MVASSRVESGAKKKTGRLVHTDKLVEAKENLPGMNVEVKESISSETKTSRSMEFEEFSAKAQSPQRAEDDMTESSVVVEGDIEERRIAAKDRDGVLKAKICSKERKKRAKEGWRKALHKRLTLEGKEYKDHDKPKFKALIRDLAKDLGFEQHLPFSKDCMEFLSKEHYHFFYPDEKITYRGILQDF